MLVEIKFKNKENSKEVVKIQCDNFIREEGSLTFKNKGKDVFWANMAEIMYMFIH